MTVSNLVAIGCMARICAALEAVLPNVFIAITLLALTFFLTKGGMARPEQDLAGHAAPHGGRLRIGELLRNGAWESEGSESAGRFILRTCQHTWRTLACPCYCVFSAFVFAYVYIALHTIVERPLDVYGPARRTLRAAAPVGRAHTPQRTGCRSVGHAAAQDKYAHAVAAQDKWTPASAVQAPGVAKSDVLGKCGHEHGDAGREKARHDTTV